MAKEKIEELLGEEEQNPEEAIPGGEKNPLEKMDQISKAKPQKKESESKELDSDIIKEMFKTGENTEGMFTPDEKEQFEDENEDAKMTVGKKVTAKGKYEKDFKNDMLKHPDQYKVVTPRGEMTVSEAIRAGYNPITKTFEDEHNQDNIKEGFLSGLNDADRTMLEQFTSPSNAQVAPADAEMYGLQPGSPMIRQPEAMNPTPQMNPMMQQSQMPASPAPMGGEGLPLGMAEQPQPEQAQPDLASLLGGR